MASLTVHLWHRHRAGSELKTVSRAYRSCGALWGLYGAGMASPGQRKVQIEVSQLLPGA